MSNKRLVLEDVSKFKVIDEPIPVPPSAGAVVKVHYAGVCHSDVHMALTRFHPKFIFPRVLGHEVSGTVHTLGIEASKQYPDIRAGDRVLVFPWGNCHNCIYCKNDDPACPNMILPGGPSPTTSYVYGQWRDGGYQSYMVVDYCEFLLKVPDDLPLEQAAVIPCSGITALNAVKSLRLSIEHAIKVKGSATVALVGAGGLALWATQIIKATYPPTVRVVAVDINEEKLNDAVSWGADLSHRWGRDESAKQAAGGLCKTCNGFIDGAIDFIGVSSVIERIYMALNVGATLSLVGMAGGTLPPILLPSMMYKNISIKGHILGSQAHCHELLALLKQKKIKPPPLSTIRLEDVQDTLMLLKAGKQRGRAVVKL